MTHGAHHHELPTSGRALDAVALSATLHCLTGCAIGEVAGMVLGTALGLSDWGTVFLAVVLAFLFGYSLTSLPLLRAGLALSAVVPIALATDTASIALMEIVDNAIMLVIPGAMEAGAGDLLFWGALSFALVVAGVVAFPLTAGSSRAGAGTRCCTTAAITRTSRRGSSRSSPRPRSRSAPPCSSSRASARTTLPSTRAIRTGADRSARHPWHRFES